MEATALAERLAAAVGPNRVDLGLAARRAASTDHAWLSPVLVERLPARPADIVVRPGSVVGIAAVAREAAAAGVPLTARGKGTGNYGQAVPLEGGIVLDAIGCAEVLDIGAGWASVEPGVTFSRLEAAARRTGQELAMFPSTVGSTVGGFVAGGAGGTGSIEHGWLWDGFVLGLDVVACTPDAEAVPVDGAAGVGPHLHAYGTTGVLAGLVVRLVPARRWVALWAAFERWEQAAAAGYTLMDRLDPKPRLLSVDDVDLCGLVLRDRAAPPGLVSVRAVVEESAVAAATTVVVDHGGMVTAVRPDGCATLTALSFNHVTLRAKRGRPDLCHLQVGGPVLEARADDVRALLPGGGLHLDGLGTPSTGRVGWGGLLIGTFRGEEALAATIDGLRAMDVDVVDPHTWELGAHGHDARLATAERFDPLALLNPGKLPGRVPVAEVPAA